MKMKQTLCKNTKKKKKKCMPTIVYTNDCTNVSCPYTKTNKTTTKKSMDDWNYHHINKF